MQQYDAKSIHVHSWPQPEELPDGQWVRSFSVVLQKEPNSLPSLHEISSTITNDVIEYLDREVEALLHWRREVLGVTNDVIEYMDREGCVPSLRGDVAIEITTPDPSDMRHLRAAVISKLVPGDDELLFAAWRMFEDIDRILGTIKTIEGDERNTFPPWGLRAAH